MATEAQLGLEFEVELELPISHPSPDSTFRVRDRVSAGQFAIQNEVRNGFQMKSDLRRSATEAQLVFDSEIEYKFALDARFGFAFESEHGDSDSNVRWGVR